jgi:hypothetical protein
MFDSLILLFIFALNKKKYFLSKKSEQGKGWMTDPPCSELIEVKPCLKMGSTILIQKLKTKKKVIIGKMLYRLTK